ncbi:hypothetical protein, partial [Legionella sp. 29fVS95]|uniref:hypothetical protein n=1 Tax=Legionella sp. 29fVS95 TaxID=3402813 RepID=UPI003AF9248F
VILHNGVNLSCGDAAANLKTRLPIAAKLELERLNHLVTTGALMPSTQYMTKKVVSIKRVNDSSFFPITN